MKITAIGKKILFKFMEDRSGGKFDRKLDWGFTLTDKVEDVQNCKWGIIITASEASGYSEGQYILMKPLMWTDKITIDDDLHCWMTEPQNILAFSNVEPKGTTR